MRVLEFGTYVAILGYDWLKDHSPMQCDWEQSNISFMEAGKEVSIQGIQHGPITVQGMTADNLWKSCKGNDIWAFAVVNYISDKLLKDIPEPIQWLLQQ